MDTGAATAQFPRHTKTAGSKQWIDVALGEGAFSPNLAGRNPQAPPARSSSQPLMGSAPAQSTLGSSKAQALSKAYLRPVLLCRIVLRLLLHQHTSGLRLHHQRHPCPSKPDSSTATSTTSTELIEPDVLTMLTILTCYTCLVRVYETLSSYT